MPVHGVPSLVRRRGFLILLIIPLFALAFSFSQSWVTGEEKVTEKSWAAADVNMSCTDPSDITPSDDKSELRRSDFPKDFVFGTATSAFQIEGAVTEGGRGSTIWDKFTHTPGKIADNSTAVTTVDHYHRYLEDVNLMKDLNVGAYRFSIAWSRIIPDGIGEDVNSEGIVFYNRLIDALISKGITPYVTLYHWDLPQPLQDKFGGWISPDIVDHFVRFVDVCFSSFGDRVKHWITFNEPMQFCFNGYGNGVHAPGRTSDRTLSPVGNSSIETYLAGHNVLISHATVVELYRTKYKPTQGGSIGLTTDCEWAEPLSNSSEDRAAAQRRLDFQLGWWLNPIFFGDYPSSMRKNIGNRLPQFTEEDKQLLRGSVDFIGLNHYTTRWVTSGSLPSDPSQSNFWVDQGIQTTTEKDGVQIGPRAQSSWLYIVPWGLQRLLEYVWATYKTPIIVCENGVDDYNNRTAPVKELLTDTRRVNYYQEYLKSVQRAIQNGADVRAYFAWSLVDNFEWAVGYTSRFGLYYVDYETQQRIPKESAKWFSRFLQGESVSSRQCVNNTSGVSQFTSSRGSTVALAVIAALAVPMIG